jgi:hypothetical protein
MNEHKPDWGWIAGGAMMLLVGGVSLWKAWLAFLYHVPVYSKGPSWMSACRGRPVSWFGTVFNHQGSSDKDRKMTRGHLA